MTEQSTFPSVMGGKREEWPFARSVQRWRWVLRVWRAVLLITIVGLGVLTFAGHPPGKVSLWVLLAINKLGLTIPDDGAYLSALELHRYYWVRARLVWWIGWTVFVSAMWLQQLFKPGSHNTPSGFIIGLLFIGALSDFPLVLMQCATEPKEAR